MKNYFVNKFINILMESFQSIYVDSEKVIASSIACYFSLKML